MNIKGIQKVAEDLYLNEQPMRPGWLVEIIVVPVNGKIGLVDTGFARTPEEYIFPALRSLGHKPEETNFVVNTHG